MLLIPAFRRLRLKESEFKVTLGYIKPYLKNAKSKNKIYEICNTNSDP